MQHRIFRQISSNLVPKGIVDVSHGYLLDRMLSYESDRLQEELAEALNSYSDHEELSPDDFEGYELLHTESKIKAFEDEYGFRATLFDVLVPEEKWEKMAKKIKLNKWDGGVYCSKNHFRDFSHSSLYFKIFGMAVESNRSPFLYDHEALHAARDIYSRNSSYLDGWYLRKYEKGELKAKVESELLEEILCRMCTRGWKKDVTKEIVNLYLPSTRKLVYSLADHDRKEKKRIWRWLNYIKTSTEEVVEAAYLLSVHFEPSILVPLFFSLGPIWQEVKSERFISPFSDVINLERDLGDGVLERDEIEEAIRKKGYSI